MTTIKLENELYDKLIDNFIDRNPNNNKDIKVIFNGEIFKLFDTINFYFPPYTPDCILTHEYDYSCDLIIEYNNKIYRLKYFDYFDLDLIIESDRILIEVDRILTIANVYTDKKSNTHEDIIPTNTPKKYIRIIDYVIENYSNCCWSIESFDDEHCLSLKGDAKLFLDSRWDINKQMNAVDFVVDLSGWCRKTPLLGSGVLRHLWH